MSTNSKPIDVKTASTAARNRESTASQLETLDGLSDAVDRLLAKHPNAPPDLLEKLSHSSDRTTRKGIAMHPNAPKEVLLRLAPQFPADFFRNPAFDWLLLEHPTLLFEIGGGVLKNVLKRPDCPPSFLKWAAEHGSEQEKLAVAMNPAASPDMLQAIVQKGGKPASAARHHAQHAVVEGGDDLEQAFRKAVAQTIAENIGIHGQPPTLAQWLALSPGRRLHSVDGLHESIEYAVHPFAPPEVAGSLLTVLASDPRPEVREALARNPATPATLLTMLGGDSESDVRCSVAGNPSTPLDTLATLAHDSDADVRRSIANNDAAPADILRRLASDPESRIRSRVARNPSSSADVLGLLARDSEADVRSSVAGCVAASVDILAVLAGDADCWVRSAVGGNPSTSSDTVTSLAQDAESAVRCGVAGNHKSPTDILAALAKDADYDVRLAVAKNPATPGDILTTLTNDSRFELRRAVAANPATPGEVLAGLSGQIDSNVGKEVAANPATPVGVLAALANDSAVYRRRAVAGNRSITVDVLTVLASDPFAEVRLAVAANPAATAEALAALAADSAAEVRRQAASNRSAPSDVLASLCGDADESVRRAAIMHGATAADVVRSSIDGICRQMHQVAFDPRHSEWWTQAVSALRPKDADLIRACNEGDLLYLPDGAADKASRKTDLAWRLLGLSHRLCAPDVLAKRSRSTEWVERMAVARNSNTPPNVIEFLRKDPHRLVARKAEATSAIKAQAAERQSQLLRSATDESADSALISEAAQRLRKKHHVDARLFGSSWSRWLAPGQWLMALDADRQGRLESVLPEDVKEAMADFWLDSSAPGDGISGIGVPGVLARLARRSRRREVQQRLAANRHTPLETLQRLASSTEWPLRYRVAGNPAASGEILAKLAADPDLYVRGGVAGNPATPADTLTKLSGDAAADVRRKVAANPATPADALARLVVDPESDVRLEVAKNPVTPLFERCALLRELARASSTEISISVAASCDTPAETLTELANGSDPDLRTAVAGNRGTPAFVLAMLAHDAEPGVRAKVAWNPSASGAVLRTLSRDADKEVRWCVARNDSAPADVLNTLAVDPDEGVRLGVALRTTAPADTRTRLLSSLAGSPRWNVRWKVVEEQATPVGVRKAVTATLVRDANPEQRVWLAKLTTLPDVLSQLLEEGSVEVVIAAANNPRAPVVDSDKAADASGGHGLGRRVLIRLHQALGVDTPSPAQSRLIHDWIDRLRVALEGSAAPEGVSDDEFRLAFHDLGLLAMDADKRAIAKASKSKDWLQRAAATYAAEIQPSLLKALLEDPVEAVRRRATSRLRALVAG